MEKRWLSGNDAAQVDRVLNGLRQTPVPERLQERLLFRVAAQVEEATRSQSARAFWLDGWTAFRIAAGVMTLVLAAVLAGLWPRRVHSPEPAARLTESPAAPPVVFAPHEEHPSVSASGVTPVPVLGSTRHQGSGRQAVDPDMKSVVMAQSASQPDGLLNQPAPEESLTAQEQLLLRLRHRHAPDQLMAMTPAAIGEQDRAERQQYAVFFAPAFRTVEEIEAMQKAQPR